MGVDPGNRATGWGLITAEAGRVEAANYGCIAGGRGANRAQALAQLSAALAKLLGELQPAVVALETPFVARYFSASLRLAEARGALLVALGHWGGEVVEYEPARIKSWIVGHGAAGKAQVAWMVQRLLELPQAPPADAADALAVALCHLFELGAVSGGSRLCVDGPP